MGVQILVNPTDSNNRVFLEDDRQVILDVELVYTDGYHARLSIYIHGDVLDHSTGETSKHLAYEVVKAIKPDEPINVGMELEGPRN